MFKATANTIIADVKAIFNHAKAKAIIITGYIGLPSKVSDKVDTMGANMNLRITKNKITPSGSMMFLSAGKQFDVSGNSTDVLGMAGLAEVNPETGAFDLSIPSYGGTTDFMAGQKTQDLKECFKVIWKNIQKI